MSLLRVPANTRGRDFCVGDVHGMFGVLRGAMAAAGFDPATDRLFLTGDVINRGPDSHEAAEFLANAWAFSVRGDHEQALWSMYAGGSRPSQRELEYEAIRNGLGWWLNASESVRAETLAMIEKMPVAIEIAGADGRPFAGVVHGEVPVGFDWLRFAQLVSQRDSSVAAAAIWGRTRINTGMAIQVEGIDRVFCGHTAMRALSVLGNSIFLDTGAAAASLGRLTIVEAAASWEGLRTGSLSACGKIDVRGLSSIGGEVLV